MMNLRNLDNRELSRHGFIFETAVEAELFAEVIREELEVRIGHTITKIVGEKRVTEFDMCKTQEEAAEWLEINCPDYMIIIDDVSETLERELYRYKDQIPGLVPDTPAFSDDAMRMTIEEMDLSFPTYNCLKDSGRE